MSEFNQNLEKLLIKAANALNNHDQEKLLIEAVNKLKDHNSNTKTLDDYPDITVV